MATGTLAIREPEDAPDNGTVPAALVDEPVAGVVDEPAEAPANEQEQRPFNLRGIVDMLITSQQRVCASLESDRQVMAVLEGEVHGMREKLSLLQASA